MRSLILGLVFLLPFCASGQELVKVNIVELYDKVPPPPADVNEAYKRCEVTTNTGTPYADPEKFYQPTVDRHADLAKRLEAAAAKLAEPMTEQMKKVDTKEIQKKMKSMSQAEQIKFAMEMQKKMGMGPRVLAPEPPVVQAAQEEYMKVNGEIADEMQRMEAIYKKRQQVIDDDKKRHADIETWSEAEKKKLPRVSGGEMDWYEEKAYYAHMVKEAEKHVAAANEHLKAVRKMYQEDLSRHKKRYSTLQQKLAAAGYGEAAKNIETKRTLNGANGLLISPLGDLTEISKDATKNAADWHAYRLGAEQYRPVKK